MHESMNNNVSEKTRDGFINPDGNHLLIRSVGKHIIRYLPLILFVVTIVVISFYSPHFLKTRNIINVLRQASALGLMAIGMSIVLIAGGIDLSVPSVMALSGILGAMLMRAGGNPVLAALLMVLVGSVAGVINGFAVASLKMIPFVVTLSMMAIATGASTWLTNKVSISGINYDFVDTVMGKIWIIPIPVIFLWSSPWSSPVRDYQ